MLIYNILLFKVCKLNKGSLENNNKFSGLQQIYFLDDIILKKEIQSIQIKNFCEVQQIE